MKAVWRAIILLCGGVILTTGCLFGSSGVRTKVTLPAETKLGDTPIHACAGAAQAPGPREESGLQVYGCVIGGDGSGIEGVKIYRAYASYEGVLIATSGEDGSYLGEFQPIPGDEMVRVWAEMKGKTFLPASQAGRQEETYYWRHYASYEVKRLDFKVK